MFKLIKISAIISCVILSILNSANADGFNERSDCPILFDVKKWERDFTLDGREYWGRHQSWLGKDGGVDESGDSFDFNPKSEKSYNIINNPKSAAAITYIGPWMKVSLSSGPFWNKKIREDEIRMIATQNGDYIENHYESKDDLNKNIPEQRFILLEPASYLLPICEIKWVSKFGYNAVADYKLNPFRFFTGKVLIGSGKIIDSETGEIIADEKGNLIKP